MQDAFAASRAQSRRRRLFAPPVFYARVRGVSVSVRWAEIGNLWHFFGTHFRCVRVRIR